MLGELITAGGSLLGNLFGAGQARASAREQMRFQERMSSTSWQRGVQDMRAAGINPILAYSQGGAESGSGSQAAVPDYGSIASSAMQARLLAKQLRALDLEYGHRQLMNQYDRGVRLAEGELITKQAKESTSRAALNAALAHQAGGSFGALRSDVMPSLGSTAKDLMKSLRLDRGDNWKQLIDRFFRGQIFGDVPRR